MSGVDSSSEDEFSQQTEGKIHCTMDPFSSDPCFETKEEMQIYLQNIGQKDIIISKDNIEIETPVKECAKECTCFFCTGIEIRKCQHLFCSRRYKPCDWETESTCSFSSVKFSM